eukprot:4670940-Prymnesium_polylepis.1
MSFFARLRPLHGPATCMRPWSRHNPVAVPPIRNRPLLPTCARLALTGRHACVCPCLSGFAESTRGSAIQPCALPASCRPAVEEKATARAVHRRLLFLLALVALILLRWLLRHRRAHDLQHLSTARWRKRATRAWRKRATRIKGGHTPHEASGGSAHAWRREISKARCGMARARGARGEQHTPCRALQHLCQQHRWGLGRRGRDRADGGGVLARACLRHRRRLKLEGDLVVGAHAKVPEYLVLGHG